MPTLRGSTSACMVRPSRRVSASLSPAPSIRASIGASGASPLASMADCSGRRSGSRPPCGQASRGRGRCVVENRRNLPAGQFIDLVADGPAVAAGGDHGRFQPRAIGVREEVVARLMCVSTVPSSVDEARSSAPALEFRRPETARRRATAMQY